MRNIKLSFAALAMFVGIGAAVAGSANFSRVETKDFYVDNSGAPLTSLGEYPTLGDCTQSQENCHGVYTRQTPTSPWVLQGAIIKGTKPF